MDRTQFEKELLELGFKPTKISEGVRTYTFSGGLWGKHGMKETITTDDNGYFMRHYFNPTLNYGHGNKWVNIHSKTVKEEIRKFFKIYSI